MLPETDTIINIKSLLALRRKYAILSDEVLPPAAYAPTDEMNMHDCLLLFNSRVVEVMNEIKAKDKHSQDGKVADACGKLFTFIRRYYDIMESSTLSFEEKVKELCGDGTESSKSLLTFLFEWQNTRPGDRAMAAPTFRAFTWTITNLQKLQIEMAQHNKHFQVKTSVLSTLVVEYGFSVARGILPVFTVKQYCHIITRVRWDLMEQKSKTTRSYGLPTDNETRRHKVYNDIDISVAPPKLHRMKSGHSKGTKIYNRVMRIQVEEISNKMHTYREPGKVCLMLYYFYICSSIFF